MAASPRGAAPDGRKEGNDARTRSLEAAGRTASGADVSGRAPEDGVPVDFGMLFDACPHPYLILRPDAAFTIAAVNDRYLAATGTRRAAIVGRGLFEVFPDNPDDHTTSGVSDLRTSLERVLRERVHDVMGVQKYDIPRRDGDGFEVKYWSPVNTPVFGPDGAVAFIIHHVEDVTEFVLMRERTAEHAEKVEARAHRMEAEVLHRAAEVKEANRQLKAAKDEMARLNQRLRELDSAKSEFFSNISHEFRTPLTLMLGPVEEILAGGTDLASPAALRQLETVRHNALRLSKLVNALLDVSRVEAGSMATVYVPTDLAALTADLASNFRSACERAGLDLTIDCDAVQAVVDREMWEKIVLNLLSNAFKFTLEGGIRVSLRARNGHAELEVRDTGTGIPAEELPRLFERFHRVKGARGRSYEGSGIGLALVRDLVRLHGGDVRVESTLGGGSAFTVTVPLGDAHLPAHAVQAGVEDTPPAAARVAPFLDEALTWLPDTDEDRRPAPDGEPRGRVLLADDNADMRAYVRRLLETAGYAVDTAADGVQALAACQANSPDLVISDVMMPNLDGFALLSRLRADPATQPLPVILLSARAGGEARAEGFAAGADDYLVKPFAARELVARVDGAIRLAATRRAAAARERDLAVAAAQARVRSDVLESITDAVYAVDGDWRIVYVNRRMEELWRRDRAELVGRVLWEVAPEPPEAHAEVYRPLRQVMETRRPLSDEVFSPGLDFWCGLTVYPRAEGGVSVHLRDVSERKRQEQALQLARDEAERASQVKSAFLATMSHELRTPLNAIIGFSETMELGLFGPLGSPRYVEYCHNVLTSARHLLDLINDILDFSRLDASVTPRLADEVIDLPPLLAECLNVVRLRAEDGGLHLVSEWEAGLPVVRADHLRVKQIVINLLSNAIKFTPHGGRVTLRAARDPAGGGIVLEVADTGIGMRPEDIPTALAPFGQIDAGVARRFEGTGLGLPVAARLTELHGGRLDIVSAPGRGTTVTVTLPPGRVLAEPAARLGSGALPGDTGSRGMAPA